MLERIWSMLHEIQSKTKDKEKEVTDQGKRNKTMNELKPAENIRKNPQSVLDISSVEKEVDFT